MIPSEIDKPTIVVNLHQELSEEVLKEVLFGIEEEGIPYSIKRNEGLSALAAASAASMESKISVGIGCTQDEIVVHHKNLKPDTYLFKISRYDSKPNELQRVLGSNAARLVKGNIFKENNDLEVSF